MRSIESNSSSAQADSARLPCGRPAKSFSKNTPRHNLREKFHTYSERKGLNQSQSRDRILDCVLSQEEHFSAAEVASYIREKFPKIGLATVYRNISLLVDAGVLRESLSDRSGQAIYELESSHHDHIVCINCDRIFEFQEDEMEALQRRAIRKEGFRERHHRHVVYAECEFFSRRKQ